MVIVCWCLVAELWTMSLPLSRCELSRIDSLCWIHCSNRGYCEPSPRANPSLVYSKQTHSDIFLVVRMAISSLLGITIHNIILQTTFFILLYLQAYELNDAYNSDMNVWKWKEILF